MGLSDMHYFSFTIHEFRVIKRNALHFSKEDGINETKKKAYLKLASACKELNKIFMAEKRENEKKMKNSEKKTILLDIRRKY